MASSRSKEAKEMTQCEIIMRHLNDYGTITSLEAVLDYGIMRLASRVNDLKNAGVPIVGETVTSKNRYGETTHYSRYRLEA